MHPVTGISLGRIAIGVASLAAPDTAAKLFRLDPAANPQLSYMTRMFGSREIALGTVTLLSRGRTRSALTLVGVAVDGADAYAGYEAGTSGVVSPATSRMLVAPAALAVVGGLLGLVKRRGKKAVALEA